MVTVSKNSEAFKGYVYNCTYGYVRLVYHDRALAARQILENTNFVTSRQKILRQYIN
jgi:hypothetical protein